MMQRFSHSAIRCTAALVAATCGLLSGCNEAAWLPEATATATKAATVDEAPISESGQTAAIGAPADPVVDSPKPPAEPLPVLNITYDALKFDIEKNQPFERSMLTKEIESLNGRTITIRGYMPNSCLASGLTQFLLMRDNLECCFGPGAFIYDCVVVEMKPGRSTDYTVRPVAVTGTLSIQEMLDSEGIPAAIYHLDGESVE